MLQYWLVRSILVFFRFLPFSALRLLAKGLRFFLQHVIRYRHPVVISNLRSCLPGMDKAQERMVIRNIYDNLAFVILEGIKGLTLSEKELLRRNEFSNRQVIDQYISKGKSVIAVCPHYNNWEWTVLSTGYYFKNRSVGIYKQINNPRLEKYIKALRARCSMHLLSTRETRFMENLIPEGRVILLMSDQNPSNLRDAIWVNFFGRDTACLHGLEKYARKHCLPVVYLSQTRIGNSRYKVELELLCENPAELAPGELTQLFMSRVEKAIRNNISPWLWTHKRWKHTRFSS